MKIFYYNNFLLKLFIEMEGVFYINTFLFHNLIFIIKLLYISFYNPFHNICKLYIRNVIYNKSSN